MCPVDRASLAEWFAGKGAGDSCVENRGTFPVTTTLLQERLRRGLPTDVITLDEGAESETIRQDCGLLRCWVGRLRRRHYLRDAYRREVELLHRAMGESDADVFHVHWTYVYGLAAARQRRRPWVLSVHDHAGRCLRYQGRWYLVHYLITRYVYYRARYVTAVSPYVAEYAQQCAGVPVTVIPNALLASVWELSETRTGDGPVIVTAGNWGVLKNVKGGIRAFALMRAKYPTARYRLYGPGLGPGEACEAWARSRGIHQGIEFRGSVSHSEMLQAIKTADALFHPSWEESFGQPVAEALALGTPVVCTSQAKGSAWLVEEGLCGRLSDACRPEEMADALCRTVEMPEETRGKVEAGKRRIRQLTDADAILGAYDMVYRQAVAGECRSGRNGKASAARSSIP